MRLAGSVHEGKRLAAGHSSIRLPPCTGERQCRRPIRVPLRQQNGVGPQEGGGGAPRGGAFASGLDLGRPARDSERGERIQAIQGSPASEGQQRQWLPPPRRTAALHEGSLPRAHGHSVNRLLRCTTALHSVRDTPQLAGMDARWLHAGSPPSQTAPQPPPHTAAGGRPGGGGALVAGAGLPQPGRAGGLAGCDNHHAHLAPPPARVLPPRPLPAPAGAHLPHLRRRRPHRHLRPPADDAQQGCPRAQASERRAVHQRGGPASRRPLGRPAREALASSAGWGRGAVAGGEACGAG